MPDLSHLWQRFVLASTLVFGLLLGIAATIFGYSNTGTVTVGFSVWHLNGVPLWSVAIVPLAVALVVGTLYHWWHNLHNFTEHMRHRRRVRELESEVESLKAHLDQLLEMPDQAGKSVPAPVLADDAAAPVETEPVAEEPVLPEPKTAAANSNGNGKASKRAASSRKRISLSAESATEQVGVPSDDTPAAEPSEEANSKA